MNGKGQQLHNEEVNISVFRRHFPKYSGIYIEGELEGVKVNVTVDTGATSTLVSTSVFNKIETSSKPPLSKNSDRTINLTANGEEIVTHGKALFNLKLGPLCFEKSITVADIEDEVILGIDTLLLNDSGPADILLSKSKIILENTDIPVKTIGMRPQCCRVLSTEKMNIPAMSEMVIDIYLENQLCPNPNNTTNVLVEAIPELSEHSSIVVAPSLINLAEITSKIRVMNPNSHDVMIHPNQALASAELVQDPLYTILEQEDTQLINNYDIVRSISTGNVQPPCRDPQASTAPVVPPHVSPMLQDLESIAEKEKIALANLLAEFSDVFSKDDYDLGLCTLTEHVIDTGDAKPVKQPPRKVPLAFANEDKAALEELTKQGSIRPSTSPWASPIVLVRKKNGKVRPCVDYRKLNAVTKKDAFPLPRIQDCLDSVSGARFFSTLDITSAYNQVPVQDSDIPKTAFVTKYGLFEYTKMPFGLCNAPATFQRVIELALSGFQWVSCLIYLDDIIVFSQTVPENIHRLEGIFQCLRNSGLKLKPEKCELLKKQVTFLGHVVSDKGIQPNPVNIEKVMTWPTPTNVSQVRGIVALGSYYRRFVKDFSKLVKPLIQLTEKNKPFEWNKECDHSFLALKSHLTSPPIMSFPRDGGNFILDTDACDISIGAVLSQIQDGKPRVISYGSRTLNKAERNYCVTDRELLAVKYFCDYYKQYLLGYHFLIRTDHQALKWLFSLKEPKNRIARWIEILSQYDFSIEHRPGKQHGNADGMSRCPDIQNCVCPNTEPLQCGPCAKCKKRCIDMLGSLHNNDTTRRYTLYAHDFKWSMSCIPLFIVSVIMLLLSYVHIIHTTIASSTCWLFCKVRSAMIQKIPVPVLDDGRLWPKLKIIPSTLNAWFKNCFSRIIPFSKFVIRRIETRSQTTWCFPHILPDIQKCQLQDKNLAQIITWLKADVKPSGPEVQQSCPEVRHYWNCWDTLLLHDGLLCRNYQRTDGSAAYLQLIVPAKMRETIMYQMHHALLSGHLGFRKTKQKTLMKYYWFNIRDDIRNWVKQCEVCGKVKKPPKLPRAPLGSMPVGAPMDRLATDFLGPFPETPRGNRHILVVTDIFTKWVEIFAVQDQSAKTTARIILNEVICRYGCPYDLLSDQGRNYDSLIFTELCKMLEIRKLRTSVANPKCNGQAERFNKTLLNMIKSYLKGQQDSWDENLGCLAAAYRMSPHETTTVTPNMLMLGREVRIPIEVIVGSSTTENTPIINYCEYVTELLIRMQKAHEVAREHLQIRAKRQKQDYDAKTTLISYKSGDLVWYASEFKQLHIAPKLRSPYSGPFLVLKGIGSLNYLIQLDPAGTKKLVHHNKLKPYTGDNPPTWVNIALKGIRRN